MPIRILALFFFCGLASALAQSGQTQPARSIVYTVHNPAAIKDYRTDPAVVRAMVDRLLLAVTGQSDRARAWRSLVSPDDKIGIKISAAGGELFTTHRDVVNALVDGLVVAGHSRSSIIVWDRSLGGMKEAGYRPETEGYRIKSIAPRDGYDPQAVFTAPVTGKLIWGDLAYRTDRGTIPLLSDQEETSDESHFARIVSSEVTKIINVPVMSDSSTNGLAGCLYNVTIPNIDNWRRFTQVHGYGGAAIAGLYSDPLIGKKVVLNLMDGLAAQYAGGPQSQPNYAVHHATLLASKDPVALDAIALQRIEQWREKAKLPPIGRLAAHVPIAEQVGIGNADLARIEVRNVRP
ncbi:MAG TPA: DUF362 domain-containing protein [Chthoniobacterales bacterium]|nr:DUF362 domain-containing protein [Chthoniobacterales bacterium]